MFIFHCRGTVWFTWIEMNFMSLSIRIFFSFSSRYEKRVAVVHGYIQSIMFIFRINIYFTALLFHPSEFNCSIGILKLCRQTGLTQNIRQHSDGYTLMRMNEFEMALEKREREFTHETLSIQINISILICLRWLGTVSKHVSKMVVSYENGSFPRECLKLKFYGCSSVDLMTFFHFECVR